MTDYPRLSAGDEAPAFTLTDQHGTPVSLSDFSGENVIVYFYPAAMTPGCTTQACDFRDSLTALQSAGYRVVGVSKDTPEKLAQFAERDALTFPLLSDPELTVHKAYGAYGEKNSYGRVLTGTLRSTIVIDGSGRVTLALYNVKATGHVGMLRRKLGISE
ncbi:thioredoxin-dependent thiol peroxidase [Microbacterium sp. MPKO10]|uniref:thioredoxin-dependent thiol peroxidase n=1 Tax=Microbacterium sp. MPKO10 TaxID=2989818 RepID=UPI0022368FEA|nr:thioredoxin-dependent thiol peroxidase [Microbacterium sp. MPKO10]MCW4458436.1 thioredoxin-dependent thiol peroxidase [Microbacterium sp. MPKO10]